MRSDQERLIDIQEAILKVQKYSNRGKNAFLEDELIQTYILYNLQIIGEAVKSMSNDFKSNYNQIAWQDIADFRNLLVHEYFRVDLEIVWFIVEQEIPILDLQINEILTNK